MNRVSSLWHELVRERTRARRRGERTGRTSRAGVALLMVITIVALMTVLVTEVVHSAGVRIQMAANQRDEAKAEALAQGGVQFYRLILVASKQMEGSPLMAMLSQYFPGAPPADALWQIIPSLNTGLLRLLFYVDGDEEDAQQMLQQGGLGQEELDDVAAEAQRLKKSFLDFDGDFSASVVDEERNIYVGRFSGEDLNSLMMDPQAGLLAGLMGTQKQEEFLREINMDKWELIGNLADWTDLDNTRVWQGGNEDSLYQRMEPPYMPKNGPFDSIDEIRLVDGWERDSVWQHFGQHLTIYGKGQVNVNTADRRVIQALLQRYIQPPPSDDSMKLIMDRVQEYRNTPVELGGGYFREPSQFVQLIQQIAPGTVDEGMVRSITTKSTIFRVTSEGTVGQAKVSYEVVFDFSGKEKAGKVVAWRIQ